MKPLHLITALTLSIFTTLSLSAQEEEFAALTIDFGVVVSDIEKSVKFYTEAVGFKEVEGFTVPADFAEESGLTDNKELKIRVLVLGEGPGATKLKLMQVEGDSEKADHTHINSTLGFSYITIAIKSTDVALERLKKAGVKPIANTPVTIPENIDSSLALTIVRDPDGNMVELVGPKPTE